MSTRRPSKDRPAGRRPGDKAPEPQSRKQRSHLRKDQRRQIIVLAFIAVVVVLLIGTLFWGWYQKNVLEPNSPIVVVNGQGVPTWLYQTMVRYQRFQLQQQYLAYKQRIEELQSDPNAGFQVQLYQQLMRNLEGSLMELPWQVLERLIDAELVRQNVASLGITVPTDAEVDVEIRSRFGYYTVPPTAEPVPPTHPPYPTATPAPTPTLAPTATATATPTPSPIPSPTPVTPTATATTTPLPPTATAFPTSVALEDFQKNHASWLQAAGISEGDLREIIRREMLLNRAQQALQGRVPASAPQVHIRHIQVADKDKAASILAQAQAIDFARNPDGFANLAREVSEDALTQDAGGDLGWQLHELLVGEYGLTFADAALSLYTPGQLSSVVEGEAGATGQAAWHIIQLVERDPDRPIDGDQWDKLWNEALSRWLKQQEKTAQIERYWSSDKVPPSKGFLGE